MIQRSIEKLEGKPVFVTSRERGAGCVVVCVIANEGGQPGETIRQAVGRSLRDARFSAGRPAEAPS